MVADLCVNSERMLADFNELAEIGATVDGGISRLALSNEDLEARAWLADRFLDAGLLVRDDDAGNLSGILPAEDAEAQHFLLGSHLDSVPNGGRYDSSIGLLTALEATRTIQEAGLKLPFHLEVINFTDEEGCWQSLFGSRALTGMLTEVYTSDRDADYGPFRAALFRAGIYPADIYCASRDPETVAGYLELHIEQGYRLDDTGIDIGVVTGIVGRTTYYLTFFGEASHSGTTALDKRRDALLGASAFICEAHHLTRARYPEGVFNCGSVEVSPGAFNIIPAEARLTMECRHFDYDQLAEMESVLIRLAQDKANEHKLSVNIKRAIHMPAASMDASTVETIEAICQRREVSFMRLISYAGHDAQIMSNFTSSGMIFIPSQGGISHSPREYTEWHHVVKGADVLLHTVLELAEQYRYAREK